MTDQELIDAALTVRKNAYSPYSGYQVGAALVDDLGQMHIGCNVENAAYPQGNCAEASAIGAMISAGGKTIVTIAVAGGRDAVAACTPCGGCRQRINEFANEQTRVIASSEDGSWDSYSMAELLPASFHL